MKEEQKVKQALSYIHLADHLKNMQTDVIPLLKKDCYNLLLNMHLGDNFITAAVVQKYFKGNEDVHFIIKKSNEIVMKLCGIKNYTVWDFSKYVSEKIKQYMPDNKVIYYYAEFFIIRKLFSPKLKKGELTVLSEKEKDDFRKYMSHFKLTGFSNVQYVCACLNLMMNEKLDVQDFKYPELSNDFRKKIEENIGPLNKIILIAPEALSDDHLDKRVWESLTEQALKMGYFVIENITDKSNHINGSINFSMNTEELLQLATHCKNVFSIRSGLCDLLIGKCQNLHIFWTKERWDSIEYCFTFDKNFSFEKENAPNEYILSQSSKPKVMFDGIDLFEYVQKSWL